MISDPDLRSSSLIISIISMTPGKIQAFNLLSVHPAAITPFPLQKACPLFYDIIIAVREMKRANILESGVDTQEQQSYQQKGPFRYESIFKIFVCIACSLSVAQLQHLRRPG